MQSAIESIHTMGGSAEIIVVDNNSSDDSISYLQPKFPCVKFVISKENIGFGRANNLALQMAVGEYVLFLNPDTLMPEDCLEKCIRFVQEDPSVGAIGVKMLDGCGKFLPESKRAFPAPFTSLFKLIGLASLFKRSKIFARYYLGHLSEKENHEVDVLAGAFMLIRKKVLDKIGGFDDLFFMYGEDIDLSYRIQQAGWKNYYFAESSIIHFKGESTRKGSFNYVKMFYEAMSLFVKKHHRGNKAAIFNIFIHWAIWLRAAFSAVTRFTKRVGFPILDAAIILCSLMAVEFFWKTYVKPGVEVKPLVFKITLPLFTVLFLITASIAGLYDKLYKSLKVWYAMAAAIIINLAAYSLLDEHYRFSRGVILFGGILAAFGIAILRHILVHAQMITDIDEKKEYRQTLIVGSVKAFMQAQKIMANSRRSERILGRISIDNNNEYAVGEISNLNYLLGKIPVKELIFCIEPSLTMKDVINIMEQKNDIRYKFYYTDSQSIVGSDNKETIGEALTAKMVFKINQPSSIRVKRTVDILCSLLFLLTIPIHLIFIKNQIYFLKNIFDVLFGKKTWVGYNDDNAQLPPIKKGVINPDTLYIHKAIMLNIDKEFLKKINYWYAEDYEWTDDIKLIFKRYRLLGG